MSIYFHIIRDDKPVSDHHELQYVARKRSRPLFVKECGLVSLVLQALCVGALASHCTSSPLGTLEVCIARVIVDVVLSYSP